MKRYTFVVVGTSHFPLDMLRYDSCWPRTSDSVHSGEGEPSPPHCA
jgi:hypothetical protein